MRPAENSAVYFFSEENYLNGETEIEHALCLDDQTKLRVKIYKWENCGEYCYMRGHTTLECNKKVKRNKE